MIYKRGGNWHMDAMVNGVRYREALHTTDKREASGLEKKRLAEIQQGKGASKTGRDFARKPFSAAADQYIEERKPHTAERTNQLERNLLRPLRKFLGEKVLMRIRGEDVAAYQRERRSTGISGRTLNMEVGVLRQIMKRGKVWSVVSEDVKLDREGTRPIAKVLTEPQKRFLFETAASKDEWLVAYCAAVLSANTTCRGIELKHLHWADIDLMERDIVIRRSKTQAGHRTIPINVSAMAALSRLRRRDEAVGSSEPNHYVFPACERNKIDPLKPQKTWRTAWRSLVEETATRASDKAEKDLGPGEDVELARRKASLPFITDDGMRFRFHDLRHQAITELSEGGASDATMMALAGHMSREMLEHYSHVRMAAKREALDRMGRASPHTSDSPEQSSGSGLSEIASHSTSQKPVS
jgi:integrase